MKYTLGSLFDGSGGFPLAGSLCGITPKWAAEIEPYPIAVTRSRYIWDLNAAKRWGKQPASEAQLRIIQRRCKGFDTTGLTKGQASQILNRLFNGGKSA